MPVNAMNRAMRRIAGLFGERSTSLHLKQFSHISPTIIRHVNGAVFAMAAVRGASYEHLDTEELGLQHERICDLHRALNLRGRLFFHAFLARTEAGEDECPAQSMCNDFAQAIYDEYRHKLLGDGLLYRNDLYLGVMIQPPALAKKRGRNESVQPADAADIKVLESAMGQISADLEDYGLEWLGTYEENGILFSRICEELSFILTLRRRKVPLPNGRLSKAIASHRPVFLPDGTVELNFPGHKQLAQLFGYSVYPKDTSGPMYDALLSAPARFVFAQSFGSMPLHEAQRKVTDSEHRMITAGDPAATQLAELTIAGDQLQSRTYGLGVHNATLMVVADDEASLAASAGEMDGLLRKSGAIIAHIDYDIENAYWGMSPGSEYLHTRSAPIKTRNFAGHAPLHNFPVGWRKGEWCDFAGLFRTNGGTAYHFNPHTTTHGGPGKVPHAEFRGPSGSGKTVVMLSLSAWLIGAAGAQLVFWDKDRGGKLAILKLGGRYFEFANGEPSGLAPLKALDGSKPDHLDWLQNFIKGLVLSDGGKALSAEDHRRVELGVRFVMRMPVAQRSIGEVCAFLGAGDDDLGARLRRWRKGETLGWVVDGDEDRLRFDTPAVGFDQTKFLDHPAACGPIQAYLTFRVGELTDGRRLLVIWDEVQKSFQNAAMRKLIADGLATFRKKNVILWLATQAMATLQNVPEIADIVREQCLTSFDFLNGRAQWSQYEERGYTRRAFDWVRAGLASGSDVGNKGRFLLRQGDDCVPLQLAFDGMEEVLTILSGREETVQLFDECAADMPEANIEEVFEEFFERYRLPAFQRMLRRIELEEEQALAAELENAAELEAAA